MKYRLATLWPRTEYSADKVETIDVDVIDPISRLIVTYEPDNNNDGGAPQGHPAKCISKVELVDGSDVLFSLTGQEIQAVDFYDEGKVRPNIISYLNGLYSEQILNVNFGRWLWDPDLAMLPARFKNPQLKISIDINGGGYVSNDGYLTVIAQLFDEKTVSPLGFMMSKELKDYALGASSHEYTDLPTDYFYKQLFLKSQVYGTGPEGIIDNVKISEDVDRKIPLNHTMYQILRNMVQDWPPYDENILVPGESTTGMNFYNTPCYWPNFASTEWRAAAIAIGLSEYEGDGGRFKHSVSSINCNANVMCKGWAPHAMVPLLPRPGMDYNDWYDVTKIRNLKLDVLTTASGASTQAAQIITQQLRRY